MGQQTIPLLLPALSPVEGLAVSPSKIQCGENFSHGISVAEILATFLEGMQRGGGDEEVVIDGSTIHAPGNFTGLFPLYVFLQEGFRGFYGSGTPVPENTRNIIFSVSSCL